MSDGRLARGTYIGGHEAVAIDGSHPFMSQVDVWGKLTGREMRDISDDPPILRGRIVEPGLLDEIERRYDIKMRRDVHTIDSEHAFFAGTVDGICDRRMYEVTSTTSWGLDGWGEDGDPDGVANYKYLQSQWYMGLKPFKETIDDAWVVLFIVDKGELRHYPIERNEKVNTRLRAQAIDFYTAHVINKQRPVVDLSTMSPDAQKRALGLLYGEATGDTPLTPELARAARAYVEARDAEDEAKKHKASMRSEIVKLLGEHEKAKGEDDGKRITVSYTKRRGSPSVDKEALIGDLARRLKMTDIQLGELRASYTNTPEGYRSLLVTLKDKQN